MVALQKPTVPQQRYSSEQGVALDGHGLASQGSATLRTACGDAALEVPSGAAEQADEADEPLGGAVAGWRRRLVRRKGQVGAAHRLAAYPRCWADLE